MPTISLNKEALAREYAETKNPALIDKLMESHARLVKDQLANTKNPLRPVLQYLHERGHTDDLMQEGLIALYNAITKYDPAKQQFRKYATMTIMYGIRDAVDKLTRQLIETHTPTIDDMVREQEEDTELKELPEQARKALTKEEYDIIKKKYGIGQPERTDKEIAGQQATSGINAKRNKALQKLRNNPKIKIFS